MSYKSGIHPAISSIIHKRDTISVALHNAPQQPEDALNQMLGLISDLDTKDKEGIQKLRNDIESEVQYLGNAKSVSLKNKRINTRMHVYRRWYDMIDKTLWEKGYLENKKYGVETKYDTTFKDQKPWTEE